MSSVSVPGSGLGVPLLLPFTLQLYDALLSVLDSVAPLKTKKKCTSRTSPWLRKKNVSETKRKCRAAETKWRKTKITIHYNIYKDTLTTYNKTIRLAIIISENARNSRVLFSTIDQLLNTVPAQPSLIPTRLGRALWRHCIDAGGRLSRRFLTPRVAH